MAHIYLPEQVDFISANIAGCSRKEVLEMFNAHFDLQLSLSQITGFIKNHGLNSGVDCRFKPGGAPFNKGKKGLGGWEPTQFKTGHKPHNYKPVGTERVNAEDYIDIKIADPNKWKPKHRLIWEDAHGSIPKGHVVIFGDSNRRNFDINNLILVSRSQLSIMNQNNLIKDDAELTRTGVIVADIYKKIGEIKRRRN